MPTSPALSDTLVLINLLQTRLEAYNQQLECFKAGHERDHSSPARPFPETLVIFHLGGGETPRQPPGVVSKECNSAQKGTARLLKEARK